MMASRTPTRKRKIDSVYGTPGQSRITQHFPVAKTPRRTMKALTLCRPDDIVCRDQELTSIRNYINSHVQAKSPGSLYIPGPPGTGKTLCVSEVVREVEKGQGVKVRTLNCMTTQNCMKAIFSSLGGKGKESAEDWVERFVCSSKDSILLVLEEVDHLKKGVLHQVFELPALDNSKLILIAVSNVLDLTDRSLSLSRLHTKPTIIPFRPYSREDLCTILTSRLGHLTDAIHPNALRFCASKVSARNGDIRDALNYCRAAIEASRGQQQVTVKELNQVMGSPIGCTSMTTLTWPLLHKIAACTLLRTKENSTTIGGLYDLYIDVCSRRQLKYESSETFVDALGTLQERGVVNIHRNRKVARDSKVVLKVTRDELEFKLKDRSLIESILDIN